MPAYKDISGQKIGMITVIKYSHSDKNGHAYFLCRCECGIECTIASSNLLSGRVRSCGCIGKSNRQAARKKTHEESVETGTNIGKIKSTKPHKSNKTTGIRGVCYIKSQGMYKAYITFQKKKYVLKTSPDIEKCIEARKQAEKEVFGNFLEWYEEHKQEKSDKKIILADKRSDKNG